MTAQRFTELTYTRAWPAMLAFLCAEPDGDKGPWYAAGEALAKCVEIGEAQL